MSLLVPKHQYRCKYGDIGYCEHGGTKRYNYGFQSGTASYCYLVKKWVSDIKDCPLKKTGEHDKY